MKGFNITFSHYEKYRRRVYFDVAHDQYQSQVECIVNKDMTIQLAVEQSRSDHTDAVKEMFRINGFTLNTKDAYVFPDYCTKCASVLKEVLKQSSDVDIDEYCEIKSKFYEFRPIRNQNAKYEYGVVGDTLTEFAVAVVVRTATVIYREGFEPLFADALSVNRRELCGALSVASRVYRELKGLPRPDSVKSIGTNPKKISDMLNKMIRLEKDEDMSVEPAVPESTPDVEMIDTLTLLEKAEDVEAYLPIVVCVPKVALTYGGVYITIGDLHGFSSDSTYGVARVQFYKRRPLERDNSTEKVLGVIDRCSVITYNQPDLVEVIQCDGMSRTEFDKLAKHYTALYRP